MKHSQTIGCIAALGILAVCFLPWVVIESKQLVVYGMNAKGTDFGTPGRVNLYFTVIMVILFAIPRVWAKRTNVFIAALNVAWSFRNYLVLTTCLFGECPEIKMGLYLLIILSVVTMLMSFFPKIALPTTN